METSLKYLHALWSWIVIPDETLPPEVRRLLEKRIRKSSFAAHVIRTGISVFGLIGVYLARESNDPRVVTGSYAIGVSYGLCSLILLMGLQRGWTMRTVSIATALVDAAMVTAFSTTSHFNVAHWYEVLLSSVYPILYIVFILVTLLQYSVQVSLLAGMTSALGRFFVLTYATSLSSVQTGDMTMWGPPQIGIPDQYITIAVIFSTGVVTAVLARLVRQILIEHATFLSRIIEDLQEQVREAMKLGQYTLNEKIGEGGMGIVYRASHAMLRRPAAIKLLPPMKAGLANVERFEREVQLTSQLTHPNTVSVYDYGRTPDGIFYYAMEFLNGIDLERLIKVDGPQPPERVVHILLQVCGAIAEAHDIGLIHRDIKPANILLCECGGIADVVKVVDFGLVKQMNQQTERLHDGEKLDAITGTPLYLAPEAITSPDDIDSRSDLYAIGAVGYFLMTGMHVFDGRSLVEVCEHHLRTIPIRPSERLGREVPSDIESVLLACLAKDPANRPKSARFLGKALRACSAAGTWTEEKAQVWWCEKGRTIVAEKFTHNFD